MKRWLLALLFATLPAAALAGNHAGQPRWFEPLTGQSNDYSTVSSSISAEFSSSTRYVEVVCTSACFIHLALSPAVAIAFTDQNGTGRFFLPANTPRIVMTPGCSGGVCGAIAAIRLSSDGTVYVTELGIGTP